MGPTGDLFKLYYAGKTRFAIGASRLVLAMAGKAVSTMPMRPILALALVVMAPAAQAAPPSLKDFSADMLARVRQAMPGRTVTLDPADPLKAVVAKSDDKDEITMFFDRPWRFCQLVEKADCDRMRGEFVASLLVEREKPTARSLRFIVRDSQYVASFLSQDLPEKGRIMAYIKPIGDDLFMILASDSKDAISLVGSAALSEIGLSEDDAWLIAVPQTRSILPRIADPATLAKQWHAYQGQAYLGSLLGLTDDWKEISAQLGPNLFAAAPSDQLVVVGKVEPGEPLQKLASGAQNDCKAANRCISPHVYRFRDGRWVRAQ